MITHYAELRLHTVSLQGVRQFYGGRLRLPVIDEGERTIAFALTPHTAIAFEETYEPIAPAHFAFEVSYPGFDRVEAFLREAGVLILRHEDGDEVKRDGPDEVNLYFRDGDGHILEVIAHRYIRPEAFATDHPLQALYLREVGFPVEQVPAFSRWLQQELGFRTRRDDDRFQFVISGTAHAVVVAKTRPWLPIAMKALPPRMQVTFGTPDAAYLDAVRARLRADGALLREAPDQIWFAREGYALSLRHQPDFPLERLESGGLPPISLPR